MKVNIYLSHPTNIYYEFKLDNNDKISNIINYLHNIFILYFPFQIVDCVSYCHKSLLCVMQHNQDPIVLQ